MCRVLFCDWPTDLTDYGRTTFFELANLSGYDIVFFDPLNFAVANDFRQNQSDLWVSEYISLSERKFMRLLATVKGSVENLREFINQGGIWVIRSNFPNSYIKVLKKSSVGNRIKYTESLTSIFFWLADFIEKYSFHYGIDHSLRFIHTQNYLYKELKNTPVKCLQTHNLASRENQTAIADNGAYGHQPVISRVTYPPCTGELYLIPYFLIQNETEKLLDVFKTTWHEKKYGPYHPDWLMPFEKKLRQVNPYTGQLIKLDHEFARLEQERHTLEDKQTRIQQLSDLLYKEGDELKDAVAKAMRIIGFRLPDPPSGFADAGFDFYLRDESGTEMVCQAEAIKDKTLPFHIFDDMISKMRHFRHGHKPKGLLIANALYEVSPINRPATFCQEIIHQNTAPGICLMSTTELFETACLILENWGNSQIDAIKESIRQDIIECKGLYEPNLRRYLSAATI